MRQIVARRVTVLPRGYYDLASSLFAIASANLTSGQYKVLSCDHGKLLHIIYHAMICWIHLLDQRAFFEGFEALFSLGLGFVCFWSLAQKICKYSKWNILL